MPVTDDAQSLAPDLPVALETLFHTPLCISIERSHSCRESPTISAMTSSATERELEKGELNTGIPAFAAVSRSTWLVPMQKQPMQSSYTGPDGVVSER